MRNLFRAFEREGVRQLLIGGQAVILIALSAIGVFAGDPDPAAAHKAVDEGDAARAKGDLAGALEAYDRAVAADSASPSGWHHRGLVRRQDGKLAEAIADLERAVELDPAAPGPHNDLGLAKADAGDLAGALASYDTSLRLAPDSALTWNNRSFARRLTGDFDGALKDATMALQLDPKYARAFLNRGLCLYDLREWEDALADLEKSVELEAEGQDYTRLRIWILRARLGKKEAADKDLRQWLKSQKPAGDRVETYGKFLLGDLAEEELLANTTGSLDSIDRLRKSEARFLAGSKAMIEGRVEDAKRHFQEALATKMKNTEIEPLLSPSPK
ncbi:MAG: tetratricopeptide repeat protein [Planctomycetes bacterium]|nr:tetratricopeptide repeat protein [Planctomycetota bacterium]